MVYATIRLFCKKIDLTIPSLNTPSRFNRFVDSLHVVARGGRGGTGYPRYNGVGGKGGDVYAVGVDKFKDLNHMKTQVRSLQFEGGHGEDSRHYRIMGLPGKDVLIPVPVGVEIRADDGRKLGDINKGGQRVLVALGGRGGDQLNQYNGSKGQTTAMTFDLKLIADVGFVGYPNAGKSTLLKAVSRASPKIASYPFTTIHPNVGIMEFPDFRKISCADLPGLIEGAHANVGLGHKFLKHVERTQMLLFVVDINGFKFGPDSPLRSPIETLLYLNKELELYNESLLDKPALLAISKMDTEDSRKAYELFLDRLHAISQGNFEGIPEEMLPKRFKQFDDIMSISSKSSFNIALLRERVRDLLDFYHDLEREKNGRPTSYRSIIEKEQNVLKEADVVLV